MAFRFRDRQYHEEVSRHLKEIGGDIDVSKIPEEWDNLQNVGEMLPSPTAYGDYCRVRDIVGSPVKIVRIEDWSGEGDPTMKSGPALIVNADLIGDSKVWFVVSQEVLYRKLDVLRDRCPFLATFHQVEDKRYFDVE